MSPPRFVVSRWGGDEQTALAIREATKLAMPLASVCEPEEAAVFYRAVTKKYPEGTWVARSGERVLGCALTIPGPSPRLVRVMGVVRPGARRAGVGSALWAAVTEGLCDHPEVARIQARAFGSSRSGQRFLERAGFELVERTHWLELGLDAPFSEALLERQARLSRRGIEVVTASAYRRIRQDWDRAWWTMESEALGDIPTELGVVRLPFEEWRERLWPPFCDLGLTLVAIDGEAPVGVLKLGRVSEGTVNINSTAVAATHRRAGISLALKVRAVELARSLGARTLSTQNHEANHAILAANRRFGFTERDLLLDYVYELEAARPVGGRPREGGRTPRQ